ncbi:MAG TPA: polyprenol monophosphomannose synthase [Anaerolineales bacterium]|nr:polyprenol monophosphomannose synthase [Anaerolineales bacterium]
MADPLVTVVIPTYNEAGNLEPLCSQLWSLPIPDLRILIVDDGSPDGTGDQAEALSRANPGRLMVIHRSGKLGLGTAYLQGFARALQEGSDVIIQMDADFSHSPAYLPTFVAGLGQADAVFGSRYIPGGRLDDRWSTARKALSKFGNVYARTILGMSLRDVTGGFRVWKSATLAAMPLDRIRSNGYVFQVEMAYVASRLGFRILELPIYFEDRKIGRSKMSFRIQLEAALRVWQVLLAHRSVERRPPAR